MDGNIPTPSAVIASLGVTRLAIYAFSLVLSAYLAGVQTIGGLAEFVSSGSMDSLATIGAVSSAALASWSLRNAGGPGKGWAKTAKTQSAVLTARMGQLARGAWAAVAFTGERQLVQAQRSKTLKLEDIPELDPEQRLERICSEFTYDTSERLFLLRAIYHMVWPTLLPIYIIDMAVQGLGMAQVMANGYLLHCLDAADKHAWYDGYVAALVLVLLNVAMPRMRTVASGSQTGWKHIGKALEHEFLRLPLSGPGLRAIGSNNRGQHHASAVLSGLRSINSTLVRMSMVAVSAWTVYAQVGLLALVPFGVEMGNSLLSSAVTWATGERYLWNGPGQAHDGRITDLAQNIRTIKLFGWERIFLDSDADQRQEQERRRLSRVLPWYAPVMRAIWFVINSVHMVSSQISASVIIFAYTHSGGGAEAQITNADLFRINGLAERMRSDVQSVFYNVRQLQTLSKRYFLVERFLRGDFLNTVDRVPVSSEAGREVPSVSMAACSFTRMAVKPKHTVLEDISLNIANGEVVAVMGAVSSGKSSLLLAICSELEMLSGTGTAVGSVAYMEQPPWVMHDSLRTNILFGRPYDEARYQDVIRACAFSEDLAQWPAGDKTVLGDEGINISGGQRSRLALARTLYSQADIYVLDDPLSAVDARTRRHILEHALLDTGLLSGKIRIVATNTRQLLPFANQVVTLNEGKATSVRQKSPSLATTKDKGGAAAKTDGPPKAAKSPESNVKEPESKAKRPDTEEADVSGSDEEESGEMRRKWPLRDNLRYIVQLCGALTMVVVVLVGLLEPVTSYIMDGMLLGALQTDDSSIDGSMRAMVRFLMMSMARDVVSDVVRHIRNLVYRLVVYNRLERQIKQLFISSIVRAPMSFFDSTTPYEVESAYGEGVQTMSSEVVSLLMYDISSTVHVALSAYRVASSAPPLLIVAPVFAWIEATQDDAFRPLHEAVYEMEHDMYNRHRTVNSVISGAKRMIRLAGSAAHFLNRHTAAEDQEHRLNAARSGVYSLSNTVSTAITELGDLAVTWTLLAHAHVTRTPLSSGAMLQYSMLAAGLVSNTQTLASLPGQLRTLSSNISIFRRFAAIVPESSATEPVELPSNWPPEGKIEFRDFSLRYREDLEPTLRNINLVIQPGEKIGIVGRSGASKSTLVKALFRLVDRRLTSGQILVDGLDIDTADVTRLRPRLGIIPQESSMLSGSLRRNLDPLGEFSVEDIWAALVRCDVARVIVEETRRSNHCRRQRSQAVDSDDDDDDDDDDDPYDLSSYAEERKRRGRWRRANILFRALLYLVGEMPAPKYQGPDMLQSILDCNASESTGSLSRGRQQLLSLCRLIIRGSKYRLVVLDEATADVDLDTDAHIHQLIHSEFRRCTVLTIAHRLETIMSSDRIIVLDKGQVVEVGPPQKLIEDDGYFAQLVRDNDFGQE